MRIIFFMVFLVFKVFAKNDFVYFEDSNNLNISFECKKNTVVLIDGFDNNTSRSIFNNGHGEKVAKILEEQSELLNIKINLIKINDYTKKNEPVYYTHLYKILNNFAYCNNVFINLSIYAPETKSQKMFMEQLIKFAKENPTAKIFKAYNYGTANSDYELFKNIIPKNFYLAYYNKNLNLYSSFTTPILLIGSLATNQF